MLSDQDLYQSYRKEAAQRWGQDAVQESENRIRKMSPEKWKAVKAEGEKITKDLASLMG